MKSKSAGTESCATQYARQVSAHPFGEVEMDKVTKSVSTRKPPAKGGSRKGIPNKVTKQLKDMILGALNDAGGQSYLAERATDPRTASAFLTLVGKVLPMQVTGDGGGPVRVIALPDDQNL
jgi:hypothetical protein